MERKKIKHTQSSWILDERTNGGKTPKQKDEDKIMLMFNKLKNNVLTLIHTTI